MQKIDIEYFILKKLIKNVYIYTSTLFFEIFFMFMRVHVVISIILAFLVVIVKNYVKFRSVGAPLPCRRGRAKKIPDHWGMIREIRLASRAAAVSLGA